MMSRELSRFALSICAAAAILAGCGGSQSPIGALGAVRETLPIGAQVESDGSWMLPEAKSESLLYISSDYGVFVYSYPSAHQVGLLNGPSGQGLCSDRDGNVFVTYLFGRAIYEYAHGDTQPIQVIYVYDSGGEFNPFSCSVDPNTNTLAVASADSNDVFFFKDETGTPTIYRNPYDYGYYDTYDGSGNFFARGTKNHIAELAKGSSTFTNIRLSRPIDDLGGLAWDGRYLSTVTEDSTSTVFDYRIRVQGSKAVIVSSRKVIDAKQLFQFTIYKHHFISPVWDRIHHTTQVSFWRYPGFGKAVDAIEGLSEPVGTAISVLR
jgi:WD40 repeat protein